MLFFSTRTMRVASEKTISKFRMPSSMCFTIIYSPKLCSLPFFLKWNPISLQVPTFAYEKRLSRIETLRLAITYIGFMTEILAGSPPNEPNRPIDLAYPPSTSHHHHHIPIQRDFIPPYNHQWKSIQIKQMKRQSLRTVDQLRKWWNI